MINKDIDVAVIGGGPAGLAAAISAREHGAQSVVILDRNSWLGGILPQCIHDGFGVEEIGRSMTGPEYAEEYIHRAKELGVKTMQETMVLRFDKKRNITAVNKKGLYRMQAKSVVLAMGCREKTRWNIMIPGDRPSGIYTAGMVQGFINLYNILPGRNVIILGSGDVGLIIARRLKFEGANVLGVVEILPYATGLPRNVVQCIDDYGIPFFFNHTITHIKGRERLEQVTVVQVDEDMVPIPKTEKKMDCDTLLLSLGLIPENELSTDAGVEIDRLTSGPVVNQNLETTIDGVFACGNCLQVYDIVDLLSLDAKRAGKNAAEHTTTQTQKKTGIQTVPGKGVKHVVPQFITQSGIIHLTLRSEKPGKDTVLRITKNGNEILKKKLRFVNPANMIALKVSIPSKIIKSAGIMEVTINDD